MADPGRLDSGRGRGAASHRRQVAVGLTAPSRGLTTLIHGDIGKIRIGVGPALLLKPLPQMLRRIAEQLPDLRVEVRHEAPHRIIQALQDGRYDLVFCYHGFARTYGDLIRKKIFEDRFTAAVRAGHPLASRSMLTVSDLQTFPLAASGPVPALGDDLERNADDSTWRNARYAFDDYNLLRAHTMGSDGVGVAPRFVFEAEFESGALHELTLDCAPMYECWMLTTRARWAQPIIKTVAELARIDADAEPLPRPTPPHPAVLGAANAI